MKAAVAALGLVFAGLTHAQSSPVGLWKQIDDETKQERSLIRIVDDGGGVLSGRVEKIIDPSRAAMVCDLCPGDLKGRPMLGLQILKGMKQNADDKTLWDGGQILDPNNGKTYKARMTPTDGGKSLSVRGYIGTPLLGRTQTWQRVE